MVVYKVTPYWQLTESLAISCEYILHLGGKHIESTGDACIDHDFAKFEMWSTAANAVLSHATKCGTGIHMRLLRMY